MSQTSTDAGTSSKTHGASLADVLHTAEFNHRVARQPDLQKENDALQRLIRLQAHAPQAILQELVDSALLLCAADSAGISLEEQDADGAPVFRWVKTAGAFSAFVNCTTPRNASPCGVTLDKDSPQVFRYPEKYYECLAGTPLPIVEGLLIPWQDDCQVRGTIWIVTHRADHKFDPEDVRLMRGLSDLAIIALRHCRAEAALAIEHKLSVAGGIANELAHKINNPLEAMVNALYLARQGGEEAATYIEMAEIQLERVGDLVKELLSSTPRSRTSGPAQ